MGQVRNLDLEERQDGKHCANKRFYQKDFTGQDLSNADFRGASLVECDFSDSDLTGANLTDANCYGANFTGTRMYKTNLMRATLAKSVMEPKDMFGATITLTCDTFEGMKIDDKHLSMWLYLSTLFDVPEPFKMKIHEIIGPDRVKLFERIRKREF